MQKKEKRLQLIVLTVLTALLAVLVPISAAAFAGEGPTGSITAIYEYDKTVFPDAKVQLYQIAYLGENNEFYAAEGFENAEIDFHQLKSEQDWKVEKAVWTSFINKQNVKALLTGTTDKNGKICFTGLTAGIYLLLQTECKNKSYHCVFDSSAIVLPSTETDGTLQYDITCIPKGEQIRTQPGNPKTPRTGDETGLWLWKNLYLAALAVLGLAGILVIWILYRNVIREEKTIMSRRNKK